MPKVRIINIVADADLAHLVERHLAKVEVASSSLVIRSTDHLHSCKWFFFYAKETRSRLTAGFMLYVVFVLCPFGRVGFDIVPMDQKILLVTKDVVVIPPLPERCTPRTVGQTFDGRNQLWDRLACRGRRPRRPVCSPERFVVGQRISAGRRGRRPLHWVFISPQTTPNLNLFAHEKPPCRI